MTTINDQNARAAEAVASGSLITRELLIRAPQPTETDDRTITGIGVPYGDVIEHLFGRETFDPGSIEGSEGARLLWQHNTGEPIGKITGHRDTKQGHEVTARISQTARGDEALTLCRDGVVTGLSIGFEPIEYRVEAVEGETDVLHWTRVRAKEFSLVTFPAYENAHTRSIMPATATPDPTITRDEFTDLKDTVNGMSDQLREAFKEIANGADTTPAAPRWESMGEFIRSLAAGDTDAAEFYERAFAGDTTDVGNAIADVNGSGFLGTFIKFIEARRPFTALFSSGSLPAKGMSVSYGQYTGDTLKVGVQPAQGADLPGPGGLAFTAANAPVRTIGGWTEVARQVIERADIEWLNTMWTAFGIRYAKEAEAHVKDAALALHAQRLDDADVLTVDDVANPFEWTDAVIDAAGVYDDNGFLNSGLILSIDRFKELSHLKGADGRPMMQIFGNGTNNVGQISTKNADGTIGTTTVTAIRGITNTGFFYDPVALKVLTNGTPVRLQDQNIINLTQAFSLYGYEAILTPFPNAILPVKFGTTAV